MFFIFQYLVCAGFILRILMPRRSVTWPPDLIRVLASFKASARTILQLWKWIRGLSNSTISLARGVDDAFHNIGHWNLEI